MTKTEPFRRAPVAQATTQRRGAMLVFALFLIVLATSLAALIMAGAAQLGRTTREAHESIVVRQLADSGLVWLRTQSDLRTEARTTLPANGLLPEGVAGEVTVGRSGGSAGVIVVTVHVRFPAHAVTRTFRFRESA